MTDAATPGDGPKRSHKWWKILLGVIVGLLLFVVVGGAFFMRYTVHRAFPDVEGDIAIEGLQAPVQVIRDDLGIPQIYADSPHDLFMAQGFVHAQERFWQMDFWRHIGAGRLSEMFGESQLESDVFLKTMGWYDIAAAQYASASPEDRAALDAYTDGVNAYLSTHSPAELSFEYSVLGLLNSSYEPEPWTPVDTLTWGITMAWDLRGNMDVEIQRAMLLGTLSADQVAQLFPPYPGDINPYIIPAGELVTDGTTNASIHALPGLQTALASVQDKMDLVSALGVNGADYGIGSNAWVISGSRTDTGMPILANDPHLAIQMPSIWFMNGLHCTTVSDECPYDVTGFSFAGVPGVIIGHNAEIAWGVTNLGPDVQDLYIEKINPDNPNQYEVNGEWVDMDSHEETIEVAGGDPVTIDVRSTRHGPIISGAYGTLDDFADGGVDTPDPYAIALRWTALDDNSTIISAVMGIDAATNWEDFRDALRLWAVPSQNFVYADVEGNIGYQSPGKIPIRANGDGTLPVPGWTDEYEWTGFIPFDELPRSFNPESGYIVTANNAVIDDSYPYWLTYDWVYGYRARRIVDLVGSNAPISLAQVGSVQFDSYDISAARIVPYLTALDSPVNAAFASWDFGDQIESSGAAAYNTVWKRMLEFTFHDDLPEDFWPQGGSRWFYVVGQMMDNPNDPFWDDSTTPEVEDRDAILQRSLDAAYNDLVEQFGDNPDDWRWGEMHTSTFRNPTLGESGIGVVEDRFNRGPFETAGSGSLVNATAWLAAEDGFETVWLPSMRMLVDLGDLSRSVATNTTGQSGHTDHPHYDDMIPLWLSGDYAPMNWTRAQVDAATETTQTLTP